MLFFMIDNQDLERIVNEAKLDRDWLNEMGFRGSLCYEDAKRIYDVLSSKIESGLISISKETAGALAEKLYVTSTWTVYKKIYEVHPTFSRFLIETEDAPIEKSIIDKLPFNSFYIYTGKTELYRLQVHGEDLRMHGMYVRVSTNDNSIRFGISLQGYMDANGKKCDVDLSSNLVFESGDCYENVIEKHYEEAINVFGTVCNVRYGEAFKKPFRLAINMCQYLCASNAEVHDVKTLKGKRPVAKIDGKMRPVAIQRSEVGFRIGEKFEKIYRKSEKEPDQRADSKGWTTVRPHVRRAHWHHYWTGPGKTVLELRWLEPVFVMGDSDKFDTVVHEVDCTKMSVDQGGEK